MADGRLRLRLRLGGSGKRGLVSSRDWETRESVQGREGRRAGVTISKNVPLPCIKKNNKPLSSIASEQSTISGITLQTSDTMPLSQSSFQGKRKQYKSINKPISSLDRGSLKKTISGITNDKALWSSIGGSRWKLDDPKELPGAPQLPNRLNALQFEGIGDDTPQKPKRLVSIDQEDDILFEPY